jgi:polar amino acid transport system substrate-binding protein
LQDGKSVILSKIQKSLAGASCDQPAGDLQETPMKPVKRRQWLTTTLLTTAGLATAGLALAWPARLRAQRRELSFVFSRAEADPRTQWLIALYREALDHLGFDFRFVDVPASRATAMSRSGEVDGELGRVHSFGDLYPELVRVEEANNPVRFVAFAADTRPAANDGADIGGWSWLDQFGGRLCTRLGIKEIEARLQNRPHLAASERVNSIEQGLRQLQLGRTDLYLDVEEAVYDYMSTDAGYAALGNGPAITEIGVMEATTGHAYLYRPRNEAIALSLAQTLHGMKAAGRHRDLLTDALAKAGYHPSPIFGERPA